VAEALGDKVLEVNKQFFLDIAKFECDLIARMNSYKNITF
jgi:hypothetical protein